jgi:hypothetical protein
MADCHVDSARVTLDAVFRKTAALPDESRKIAF